MASSVTESSFPILCQIKSQPRVTWRSVVRVSFPDFASGSLSFRRRSFVVGQRWKFVSCVGSDSSGAASGGDDEQQEDALQATIDKSKKVLDMQRNLLHQIAERRKLVSSIKDTTPNLDHGKPSANEDYGSSSSSVSANTDAIKKEENGNGSASSSSYGKSSLNKVPEANKTSPLLERSKLSSASSPATSPEKEKPSGVASRGKPWSSVVDPSSALTSSKKTSDNGNPSKSPAGAFWSDPLPSYLTKTPETSSIKTEEYMETKEEKTHEEEASSDTVRDEEKPPPLAGANVMNVILVAAECAPFSKTTPLVILFDCVLLVHQ